MDKRKIAFHIFFVVMLFIVGWTSGKAYDDFSMKRENISFSPNETSALDVAKVRDSRGDFVCINVAYDMTPKEAYKTCVHECTHKSFDEIFAEDCEAHPSKCYEGLW